MRIPLGKVLRFILDRLKGKVVRVGGIDIELDKAHEFPHETGPVNEGLRNEPKK